MFDMSIPLLHTHQTSRVEACHHDHCCPVARRRALLCVDQKTLAELSGLSVPTIQRMEASDGVIRGNVDSLMKLVEALAANGIELIGEGATSSRGGRGVRLK